MIPFRFETVVIFSVLPYSVKSINLTPHEIGSLLNIDIAEESKAAAMQANDDDMLIKKALEHPENIFTFRGGIKKFAFMIPVS